MSSSNADHGPESSRFIKFLEMTLGPDHEETAKHLTELAMAYQEGENYDEAADLFKRILAIHEKNHGMEHPLTTQARFNVKAIQREIELQPANSDDESDGSDDEDSDDYDSDGDSIEDEDSDVDSNEEDGPSEMSTYAQRARLHTAQRRRESKAEAGGGGGGAQPRQPPVGGTAWGGAGRKVGVVGGAVGEEEDNIVEIYDPNTKSTYFQSQRTGKTGWTREELLDSEPVQSAKAPASPIEPLGLETVDRSTRVIKGMEQSAGIKQINRSKAKAGEEKLEVGSMQSDRATRTAKPQKPQEKMRGGQAARTTKGGSKQASGENKRAERMTPLQQYNQKRSQSVAVGNAELEEAVNQRPRSSPSARGHLGTDDIEADPFL
jgi:hypothetical protein